MRWFLKALAICLAATSAAADGRWQQIRNNADCSVWSAGPRPFETVTWTGACVDGKANGRGVLMWRYLKDELWVEEKYEGEIKDGKRHGRGVMKYANRSEYDGEWKDGKRHGRGVFEYANGGRTDGEWKDVTGSGRGVFVWTRNSNWSGDKYEGEYKDGKRHGRGVFRFSNGNECNGKWHNNSLRGMGKALRQGRRTRCYEDNNTIKFAD